MTEYISLLRKDITLLKIQEAWESKRIESANDELQPMVLAASWLEV